MADDGYLIGFEDSSGNFVEVGRFNNLSENTSDPVFIEHTGSGTRMELDGSGFDMNGNDITNAGSVSTGSIDFESGIGFESGSLTLADDDAQTIYSQTGVSKKIEVYNDEQINTSFVGLGAFNSLDTIVGFGFSNEGGSTLSGTSGPDGTLNVAVDGSSVVLENRTGASLELVWIITSPDAA